MIKGKITMENGEIIPFELYEEDAPGTVANFVKLVKEGYYDGKTFHRVIPGFVSQGGCPNGDGTGDLGYTIPCETKGNPHRHIAGAMSMAHRGAAIPAAASSSSCMSLSRIWMGCIRSLARSRTTCRPYVRCATAM